jgi:hypothetical protein
LGLESGFLLRGQGANNLRWLTSHDQMIGFAARTHSDTSLKLMGAAVTAMAAAKTMRIVSIRFFVVQGFMHELLTGRFRF